MPFEIVAWTEEQVTKSIKEYLESPDAIPGYIPHRGQFALFYGKGTLIGFYERYDQAEAKATGDGITNIALQ